MVIYHAHNHGALRRGPHCGDWTLFVTKHAVAVHRRSDRRWAWAYVSTGVDKLRWPSLVRVACDHKRGVLVLERDLHPSRELWVVLPKRGLLGRLPLPPGTAWFLQPDQDRLVIGRQSYALLPLLRALAKPDDMPDLDGDDRPDRIEVRFTGGAHCCYRCTLRSSRSGRLIELPFFQDGGLVGADPAVRPHRFLVADFDHDGLPDLQLRVNTYNGRLQEPSAALRRYGVRSHRVVVGLAGGKLSIRDLW